MAVMTKVVRLLCAAVFLGFGTMKFAAHASEVRSFTGYGIPQPRLVVPALGLLELAGGLLLLAGRLVRPVALALSGVMVGAIATSGIAHQEIISLTLAPAMLLGLLFLLSTPDPPPPGDAPLR